MSSFFKSLLRFMTVDQQGQLAMFIVSLMISDAMKNPASRQMLQQMLTMIQNGLAQPPQQ